MTKRLVSVALFKSKFIFFMLFLLGGFATAAQSEGLLPAYLVERGGLTARLELLSALEGQALERSPRTSMMS